MYVRIALSWRANIAFSSSLTSSRASLATCSTCSLLISTAFSVTSRCHPERSEGSLFRTPRFFASLRMTINLTLFYSHALGQVPRLIHVGSPQHRDVVRQQLQRHRKEDRREQRVHVWNCEHHVGRLAELPLARRDKGDDRRPAGLHFHQVAHRLLVQAVARRQPHDPHCLLNQRDRPVLHLSRPVPLRMG